MIVGHVDLFLFEPSIRSLAAALYLCLLNYTSTHCKSFLARYPQIFFEESEKLLPTIYCWFLTIIWPVIVEEAVPSLRVHVKLVVLSILLQFLFQQMDMLRCWILVLFAEQAQ